MEDTQLPKLIPDKLPENIPAPATEMSENGRFSGPDSLKLTKPRRLSNKIQKAALMLGNPSIRMTKKEIAKECGVSTRSIRRNRRRPEFQAIEQEVLKQHLTPIKSDCYRSLCRELNRGGSVSVSAAKTLLDRIEGPVTQDSGKAIVPIQINFKYSGKPVPDIDGDLS